MDCVVCISDKELSARVIKDIYEKGIRIIYILIDRMSESDSYIQDICQNTGVKFIIGRDIAELKQENVSIDLLISFNYGFRIPSWLIERSEIAINFHPAPLPKYQGSAPSSWGIINGEEVWAVTCHHLNEEFDKGDIIDIEEFVIDNTKITNGAALSEYSWSVSHKQLMRILDDIILGNKLPRIRQSKGIFYNRKMLEDVKKVTLEMSSDEIDKRIRGLWHPPFEGAYIMIDGSRFYLINQDILDEYFKLKDKCEKYEKLINKQGVFKNEC